ncbi:MAG: AAA family ATPase [Chloroflexota bacterium]|nr:AAA family ATPase [Chloroflexota bacterium]
MTTQPTPLPLLPAIAGEWPALLADLRLLDDRLQQLIARLRAGGGPADDSDVRGLIIGETDVDRWLTALDDTDASGASAVPLFTATPGGRLAQLGALFGLEPFEQAAILTALAPEVDLAYANLYAYAQDDVTRKFATVDLVLALWCPDLPTRLRARQRLAADAPLRQELLLAVDEGGNPAASLLTRPLVLDTRIAAFLLGSDRPDPVLGDTLLAVSPSLSAAGEVLPAEVAAHLERLARHALGVDRPADLTLLSPLLKREGANGSSPFAAQAGVAETQPPVAIRTPPASKGARSVVVWLRGPEGQGKRAAAEGLAATLGRRLLVVDCAALMANHADSTQAITRTLREARLQGGIVYWAGADALAPKREESLPELGGNLLRPLAGWPGCALFDIRTVGVPHLNGGPLVVDLDFPSPGNEQRRVLWDEALAGHALAADVDLGLLTGAFRLTGDQISGAAESAAQAAAWHAHGGVGAPIAMRDLVMASRAHSNQGLGMLARKIIPRYTWNDLVLPSDRLAQLHEMCSGVRFAPIVFEQWGFDRKLSSGKGVNVLFAGAPGTGKTMAAEVLATDLGLDLYKIDLSALVSKYIGETEKNLEKIFREGHTSNAILFFDEADSIFGKRSEVKDSHDRYANMEISYLLQRMEEYDGIVILATNLRKNMDEAFVRRMRGAIEFPLPEETDRLEIWRRTFPVEAPLDPNADLAFLARAFKFSGGNIKNIVLEAAFLAAQSGTTITMTHLVHATRREHQKTGRLIAATDFGPYADLARKVERAA